MMFRLYIVSSVWIAFKAVYRRLTLNVTFFSKNIVLNEDTIKMDYTLVEKYE